MKFTEMYQKVSQYWPQNIDVSDCTGEGDSWNSRKLWSQYESIQERLDAEGWEWEGVVNFSIYIALGDLLLDVCPTGEKVLKLNDIDLYMVEAATKHNLKTADEFQSVYESYHNDLKTLPTKPLGYTLKFTEMYKKVSQFWPQEIDVSDGTGEGRHWESQHLLKLGEEIEERLDPEGWESVVNQGMCTALRFLLPDACLSKEKVVYLKDIDLSAVELITSTTLRLYQEYEAIFEAYENDLDEADRT
ncbi:hypothetical protein [Halodesulfovibrio spirochaetisodalis]|uniref:Uncharacterized protein n=1 Tax=Halodesulfovibrio spirochaetisodalis TaxID=1560234 RepID=A0A1B7XAX2_9BACT|nr:hypothetical protein [Halodesulfovibrio spirochaetisodalis]OBQ46486.1 hypothetical protein SP90_12365 [Halodesulfovibrio spirochaetisodalis]